MPTIMVNNILLCRSDMDTRLLYKLAKAMPGALRAVYESLEYHYRPSICRFPSKSPYQGNYYISLLTSRCAMVTGGMCPADGPSCSA